MEILPILDDINLSIYFIYVSQALQNSGSVKQLWRKSLVLLHPVSSIPNFEIIAKKIKLSLFDETHLLQSQVDCH